jgi:DNA gyrase/topoisomerase IV subunit A
MKKNITEFINDEYKSYSKYVLYNRAIGSVADGFKAVHRKIFFLIKDQKEFIKTASLAGNLISKAGYNHGDASGGSAASLMAQSFVGSNNVPLLDSKGSFGNRFINDPSATRYTYVKAAKVLPYLFKDFDLCPENIDPENPEPLYYLPIVPTILLNGIKGIAVGFACDIPSFNIHDLINESIRILSGGLCEDVYPFYKGYKGALIQNEEGNLVQTGIFRKINEGKIHITEVPVSYDREKYISYLNTLIDKNLISNYTDNSKEEWDIVVSLPRKSKVWEDPIKHLKLYNNINYNLTCIDENENLKIFNSPKEIIEYFVKFRVEYFEKRRLKRIKEFNDLINFNMDKIKFIKTAMEYDFKNKTKEKIWKDFVKDFVPENLEKFLKMSISNINKDTIEELKVKIKGYLEERKYYQSTTKEALYIKDLEELKTFCEKEKM